jgi:hypothetical protein
MDSFLFQGVCTLAISYLSPPTAGILKNNNSEKEGRHTSVTEKRILQGSSIVSIHLQQIHSAPKPALQTNLQYFYASIACCRLTIEQRLN